METNRKSKTVSDDAALSWAESHFAYNDTNLLRNSPWARTYRLNGQSGSAYLKIVPDHQATVLHTAALLAQRFPGRVPGVLALDAERGWLLSADHGGGVSSYD